MPEDASKHREALSKLEGLMNRPKKPQETVTPFKTQLEQMKAGKRPYPVPELVAKNAEHIDGIDPVALEDQSALAEFRTLAVKDIASTASKRDNPTPGEIQERVARYLRLSERRGEVDVDDALFMPPDETPVGDLPVQDFLNTDHLHEH